MKINLHHRETLTQEETLGAIEATSDEEMRLKLREMSIYTISKMLHNGEVIHAISFWVNELKLSDLEENGIYRPFSSNISKMQEALESCRE
ncbi:MAG: hypothetical protein WCI36_05210 [bacterium]